MQISWFAGALLAASVHAGDVSHQPPVLSALGAMPAVTTTTVRSSLEQRDIRAQLVPRRYTTLAAEIEAKINRVTVQEGAAFKQGQVLVGFDCSLPQAQFNRARAVLAGAERTWAANQRLAELNAIGKVELDVSQVEVMKNQAEVAITSAVLAKCTVIAPFSGRVAEQRVRDQQYVQAGQPLLEIIDDSTLELKFLVPSKWLAWVKPGHAFQVLIDETMRSYPAKVLRVNARVDPVSQTVKLVAAIDGRFPDLIAGMSGQVDLASPPADKRITP
ncbi:MAG: efflux RND transporter periplasmic adaptor subunit [Burkholderiaceae bacterium]|nr:efflux RND transporter periplasmic adaptor subunit [Burkholderiaceae bacterium]MDH3460603.1 efflux RND transporter periplasmic adaptor subunit [Burkholderiaceae bacterium]